ncbi:MAG: hypothetical protein MJ245_07445 [Clostridia bacterium]|nr:hypothetical protein [Clostridia bacterium]
MADKHISIGIYPNKEYIYNIVSDSDLENHIEFNLTFRPGRIFYVDGKRLNNGCLKEECLKEYDDMASEIYNKLLDNINRSNITRPYR